MCGNSMNTIFLLYFYVLKQLAVAYLWDCWINVHFSYARILKNSLSIRGSHD
jgi:hypothetical protein